MYPPKDYRFLIRVCLLYTSGRYFWYLSLARATQVIAAYAGDMFAGVLLAEIKGEDKKYRSFWKSFYVKVFDVLQNLFAKGGSGVYDEANREMFTRYCKQTSPDGEILFLAANPAVSYTHLDVYKRQFLFWYSNVTVLFLTFFSFAHPAVRRHKRHNNAAIFNFFIFSHLLYCFYIIIPQIREFVYVPQGCFKV